MPVLTSLKLVTSQKQRSVSPIVQRRQKLIDKIDEQLKSCEAQKAGEVYAPKRMRTYTNKHTGERMTVEAVKRVKNWFWIADDGKINLSIKYGSKTLALNKKGANAIQLTSGDELIAVLSSLKAAVAEGELDEAINEVSSITRDGFKK
jgi:hypothetical protein